MNDEECEKLNDGFVDETEEFLRRFVVDLSQMLRDEDSIGSAGEQLNATAAWEAAQAQAQTPLTAEELAEQQESARVERHRVQRERRDRARRLVASWRQGPARLWFDALGLPDARALSRLLVEFVLDREEHADADVDVDEERSLDRLLRQFFRLYRSQLTAVRPVFPSANMNASCFDVFERLVTLERRFTAIPLYLVAAPHVSNSYPYPYHILFTSDCISVSICIQYSHTFSVGEASAIGPE